MENTIFSLNNKLALITGGGSGIGFEIAKCFIEYGAKVIITGRREQALKDAVTELGSQSDYVVNDVTDLGKLPALVQHIEDTFGAIDILVNNAGVNMKKPALDVSDEDFYNIVHTNLNAVFSLTRECARRMIPRERGSIIMITSMAAYYGIDRVVAYGASKTGVEGMIKILASEFSPANVRINAIAPGFIETAMMKTAMNGDPDRIARAMRRTPMGRFGKPSEIGYAAVFLASEASSFITGTSIPVDGGNSIGF
ncbi:NAD(P)-dependent dehydrogenase, short-chain alcohol dehydrogenase family [Pseudarcicella hirudinis]|uniref:NAD(P)-dependent dehydrogenase, short-chain alcohol dehydrogenase family n=1 Tax=Pseudarcicella hirudinis TaxID=1079859 RepID=A0A1I5M4I2_9BACT|nr:SDR family NAD(P)-dependent oxidoreductase [Pseudarcicella hirudinis]SFP03941.1 NAD(P)-dependent dehydrogenase, short-chain alcohol dehydrogenase family [Pseudarcicella hirudinis]